MGNKSSSPASSSSNTVYSSRQTAFGCHSRPRAERGYTGLLEDIATANCLAPLFRDDEGQQLLFSLARHLEPQQQANFQSLARVVVRRNRCFVKAGELNELLRTGNLPLKGRWLELKPLNYLQFQKVLQRMDADAEVALCSQMTLREYTAPVSIIEGVQILGADGKLSGVHAHGSVTPGTASCTSTPESTKHRVEVGSSGGARGGGPQSDEVRKRLHRFYEAHNVAKLGAVGDLVKQYQDKGETLKEWNELNQCLLRGYGEDLKSQGLIVKYGVQNSDASAGATPQWVEGQSWIDTETFESCITPLSISTPPPRMQDKNLSSYAECLICQEDTRSGVLFACLHGPFCDNCTFLLAKRPEMCGICPCCRLEGGTENEAHWMHIKSPGRQAVVDNLISFIKGIMD